MGRLFQRFGTAVTKTQLLVLILELIHIFDYLILVVWGEDEGARDAEHKVELCHVIFEKQLIKS